MYPHKFANIVHWSESITMFMDTASSEVLQSALAEGKPVDAAVDEMVTMLAAPYESVVRGQGA